MSLITALSLRSWKESWCSSRSFSEAKADSYILLSENPGGTAHTFLKCKHCIFTRISFKCWLLLRNLILIGLRFRLVSIRVTVFTLFVCSLRTILKWKNAPRLSRSGENGGCDRTVTFLWLQKLGHKVCLVSGCIIMQECKVPKSLFRASGFVVILQFS